MELGTAYVDDVTVKTRHRAVNADKVDALAESITAIGLQNPIHIYAPDDETCELVAGLHRLEAARKLGWASIPCLFIDSDDLDRELWEIDENLIRAELTELERSQHLARRKEIWEARNNTARTSRDIQGPGQPKGFAADTEAQTGTPKRTTQQAVRRAERIAPDVQEAIEALPSADKGVELDALASLEPDEQRQAVERVQSGASKDFREARNFIQGDDEDRDASRTNAEFEALRRAWMKASNGARDQFREWLSRAGYEQAA